FSSGRKAGGTTSTDFLSAPPCLPASRALGPAQRCERTAARPTAPPGLSQARGPQAWPIRRRESWRPLTFARLARCPAIRPDEGARRTAAAAASAPLARRLEGLL